MSDRGTRKTNSAGEQSSIADFKARLADHPDVRVEEATGRLEIMPSDENGFGIILVDDGDGWTVTFGGGWHEHFKSPEEAIDCAGFGLSDRCRLRVDARGGFAHRWTVEHFDGRTWSDESTTGLMFFPFWRRKSVCYLQNTVIRT